MTEQELMIVLVFVFAICAMVGPCVWIIVRLLRRIDRLTDRSIKLADENFSLHLRLAASLPTETEPALYIIEGERKRHADQHS